MKEIVPVPELVANQEQFGYSQCIAFDRLVFVSGQASVDRDGAIVEGSMESQARRTFENLRLALTAAGSGLDGILSMTCFIVDIGKNGPAFWKVRKAVMPDTCYTSTTIGVSGLVDPRLVLELQCTALRAEPQTRSAKASQ
jgi:enamine deaminase RidA (YjgF/YER057c/UK114 family)